jgi:hypothetical protein
MEVIIKLYSQWKKSVVSLAIYTFLIIIGTCLLTCFVPFLIRIDLDLERPLTDIEKIRKTVSKDSPYYPVIPGSENPYRDGYVTEPPRKPRASYLFFQTVYRSQYNKQYPEYTQSEVMAILGDTRRSMSESEQAPYIQLAQEEAIQYEKEKALLEKAQRPNELWQPMRHCRMVLDCLVTDTFCQFL